MQLLVMRASMRQAGPAVKRYQTSKANVDLPLIRNEELLVKAAPVLQHVPPPKTRLNGLTP